MRTCSECRVRSPCPLSHCWSGRQSCLSARWSIHRTLFKGDAQRCDPFSGLMTENEGKQEGVGKPWKHCFVTQEMGKSPRLQRLTVPFILQYDPSSGHQRNTLSCSFYCYHLQTSDLNVHQKTWSRPLFQPSCLSNPLINMLPGNSDDLCLRL